MSFDTPTIFPERIKLLEQWKDLTGVIREPQVGKYAKPWFDFQPRSIFWIDMGDAFTVSLPLDWLAPYLPAIARSPHRHLFLTKRPDRAAEFSLRPALPPWSIVALWRKDAETESVKAFVAAALASGS